ncbi:hypothetical protein [Aquimarina muelleri]|uniref:Uncharacterized protein n=1 Tax=Aquimarina muelleri TaxID=279356 RepID=A0A918JWP0_9FLAO|nr:hypothetical protein [Aquimarina muelleri]MCX2762397.1 hypothetical protein [Aquimarina muelleri]GGX24852.1 hypothetical protein GCM10007384_27370 [Aquimarina muelleri]
MKYIIKTLFAAILFLICIGYYYKNIGNHVTGDKFVGVGILVSTFILMPVFIYHRWKNKNVKDYMLTEENINKMKNYEKEKESKNP